MTLYAVGDLQGCLEPLDRLLEFVGFDTDKDKLWITGDLVNRGPDSIGTLKFIRALGDSAQTVLGNHDLHLVALNQLGLKGKDDDINRTLQHKEIDELCEWLVLQPMLLRDKVRKFMMTHAGIPPQWSDKEARSYAREVEAVLADKDDRLAFFDAMYGNKPDRWTDELAGHDRLRYIVNAYTRMRFCGPDGELEFKSKSSPDKAPENMLPWFRWPAKRKHKIVFGHWAALMGKTGDQSMIGLDTGYVWGNHLTLMNLDSGDRHCCDVHGRITTYSELEFKYMP